MTDGAARIEEFLAAAGKRILGVERFGRGSSMDTLGSWSSIRHVQILAAMENEFAIEFDEMEAPTLRSFDAIVEAVARKKGMGSP